MNIFKKTKKYREYAGFRYSRRPEETRAKVHVQRAQEGNRENKILPRGELSYLAPLGSENISAPYFKQCFFQGGIIPPDSQTPRLPVPRQK